MNRKIELAMGVALVLCAFILAKEGAVLVQSYQANKPSTETKASNCIVIDAGHGGTDPGKVGIDGSLEKDINLAIALKLQDVFEAHQLEVILTRDSDVGLYSEGATNKKAEDMQKRCKLIEEANPAFTISIHQNSYTTEDVAGAQVFYFGQSEKGKELAEILQTTLIEEVDPENHRTAKANESYYLLKKTPTPTVIVECGFLSNSKEAALLQTEEYQEKLVNAIYDGVETYLQKNEEN